jgi:hypothetical protein
MDDDTLRVRRRFGVRSQSQTSAVVSDSGMDVFTLSLRVRIESGRRNARGFAATAEAKPVVRTCLGPELLKDALR